MLANSFFGNTGLFMTKQYMRDKKWHRNQSKRKDCIKHLRLYRLGKLLRAINGLRGRELDKKSLLKIWGDHGKGDEHRAILLNFFESEFIEEGNRLLPKGASTITSSATQEGSAGLLTSFHCHVQLSNGGSEKGQGDKTSGMVVRGVVQEGTSTSNISFEAPQSSGL
jgi:hypothetical protein